MGLRQLYIMWSEQLPAFLCCHILLKGEHHPLATATLCSSASPLPPLFSCQVNYVCKAANLYEDAGYKLSGTSYVINKFLGTSWIWDR